MTAMKDRLLFGAALAAALAMSPALASAQGAAPPSERPAARSVPSDHGDRQKDEGKGAKPQREDQMKPGTTPGSAQNEHREGTRPGAVPNRPGAVPEKGAAQEKSEHRGATVPRRAEQEKNEHRGSAAMPERNEHRGGAAVQERNERRGGTEERTEQHRSTSHRQVNVSREQRTVIHRTIVEQHVQPVREVHFDVRVGTRVPHTVRLHRLPPRIVEIVPAYSGYEFFMLASGDIVVVDPGSLEIVAVIPA